ncbi:DNA-binding transcriptional MocR family regulator [Paraburkholderia sp. JPY465]
MALATLAPELTWYVTGFSKTLGAGLRVAYLRAPTVRQTQCVAGALRTSRRRALRVLFRQGSR